MPDHPATLNRQQMEDVLKKGGSVLYAGRIISRVEELPTAVQLAQNDEQRDQARAALVKQKADIEHQLTQLDEAAAKPVDRPADLKDADAPKAAGHDRSARNK